MDIVPKRQNMNENHFVVCKPKSSGWLIAVHEIIEKKSRFIGYASWVNTEDDAAGTHNSNLQIILRD